MYSEVPANLFCLVPVQVYVSDYWIDDVHGGSLQTVFERADCLAHPFHLSDLQ